VVVVVVALVSCVLARNSSTSACASMDLHSCLVQYSTYFELSPIWVRMSSMVCSKILRLWILLVGLEKDLWPRPSLVAD